jgi:hypothetical protein
MTAECPTRLGLAPAPYADGAWRTGDAAMVAVDEYMLPRGGETRRGGDSRR